MCSKENMEDGIKITPNDRKIETEMERWYANIHERDTRNERRNAMPENVENEYSTTRPYNYREQKFLLFLLWRSDGSETMQIMHF